MSFRRRTFPEVLDNLLVSIAGGVAAETHPFPPPGATAAPYRHSLQQPPVGQIVSVYGSRDGQSRLFRRDTDYRLAADRQTLEWPEGAALPDPGTLIAVNYFPASAQPVLTDLQTGSVVRTLSESVALEIARLSAVMEGVYRSGFVDTATGSALDNVVALLGITRFRGGRPAGLVEFTRVPGSRGTITILAGTRILTEDGSVEYETTESVTLAEGQTTLRVAARDLEANDPLPADSLTVLPVPIAGIGSVTNPAPTAIATEEETDAELRERAKGFLHGSERATLGALRHAIGRQQISADIEELETPGIVEVTPHVEAMTPELQERLYRAINDARPAGVRVVLKGAEPPRKIDLELRLTSAPGLVEQDLRAAQHAVREKIEDYFARLPAREPGSVNQLVGLVLSVPEIKDVRIVSAEVSGIGNVLDAAAGQLAIGGFPTVLGELAIADPNLPTLLNLVVAYPAGTAPPDSAQIEPALAALVAYLNGVNASEPTEADAAKRQISYGKLLHVLPLPGKPGAALADFDAAPAGTIDLPTEADIAPYRPQFVLTLESGMAQVLEHDGDSYELTPFERLSVAGVALAEEDDGG